MPISDTTRSQIESALGASPVVLFMKGTPQQPQCGFSATVIGILDKLSADYTTVNVLENAQIRDGIKEFSNWPTIPQLYVEKEFLGGCDIVKQMFNNGELHGMFGIEPPDRTPPEITISDAAAKAIGEALAHQPGVSVHLGIDASWNHQFSLGPAEGHEIEAKSNDVAVLFDLDSAQRARGLRIDMGETLQGKGFSIDNPNAPPPINQMSALDLKHDIDAGKDLHLFDVRDAGERERASIEGSQIMDETAAQLIETLPKDAMLVFHCHFGPRSQSAADHFRLKGYTNVHNLTGGIDAWAQEVDPSVSRY